MGCQEVTINGKAVQHSLPYTARMSPLVGRTAELECILASWMTGPYTVPLSPLMIGAPGTGKNRLVYECARITRKPLFIINGHDDLTPEDIVCSARISDNETRKIDYVLSPLVTAMGCGGICFFDEIGKCSSRALAPLASLLDERRYVDSILLGERIYAQPGFRFVAATNTTDTENSAFPDFIKSRLRPAIEIGYPRTDEILAIVTSRYPHLDGCAKGLVSQFWKRWHGAFGDRPPSPRDVISLFGLAINIADFTYAHAQQHYALCSETSQGITPRNLDSAFDRFFKPTEETT